ncbi:hypothetical protein ASPBRDRAFT_36906 [Aspergillus brasiliensis CBS 101740]|uniref:Secreted protein n=1 Tax=Aspergillus brasiliensis (strain CBS 101740 / IMI 381727 / IBT 21946) TaxID=767769 RepID=A0A1L9V1J8_ASPBC|nr:hypothetical protein ASPBRDRAFT_36906 [Aspergillus brasiliensis CBS 101740]
MLRIVLFSWFVVETRSWEAAMVLDSDCPFLKDLGQLSAVGKLRVFLVLSMYPVMVSSDLLTSTSAPRAGSSREPVMQEKFVGRSLTMVV